MDDYEIKIEVKGTFPKIMKSQITKEIQVIKEFTKSDSKLRLTLVSVTVEADSSGNAIIIAHKKLFNFLGFYSLMTFNHITINRDVPAIITRLTGKRKTKKYDLSNWGDRKFNSKIFVNEILPYFPEISKKGNEYLKTAIYNFRKIWFEYEQESNLLNCIVSLEALYSKSGEKTEMTYKLSNRVATLLGKNSRDRTELREKIRDFYDLRSKIVHGEHIELPVNSISGPLVLSVRESILRFLILAKKYPNHKAIIDKIDDAMIDNSILKKLRTESEHLLHIQSKMKRRRSVN